MEWQPIETAPKDGTKIWVVSVDDEGQWWEPDVAWWDQISGRWESGQDYDEWPLTHWQHLTKPPRLEKTADSDEVKLLRSEVDHLNSVLDGYVESQR